MFDWVDRVYVCLILGFHISSSLAFSDHFSQQPNREDIGETENERENVRTCTKLSERTINFSFKNRKKNDTEYIYIHA